MYTELKKIIDKSQKIVFFGGAGVSTESNIPDFRSKEGLYNARQQYGHTPEEILSYSFFMREMDIFYDYYKKNLVHGDAAPNKAHLGLAELEKEGKLSAIITQNIDGLHQKAGNKKVYELHGSILKNTCMDCGAKYTLDYILSSENCNGNIPVCKECKGVVKPDVVLYGEGLDERIIKESIEAISKADTLIVGGTSLVVYPAAGLIDYFNGENMVLINKEKTSCDKKANLVYYESIGNVLGELIGV